jgi:hypothetical protein
MKQLHRSFLFKFFWISIFNSDYACAHAAARVICLMSDSELELDLDDTEEMVWLDPFMNSLSVFQDLNLFFFLLHKSFCGLNFISQVIRLDDDGRVADVGAGLDFGFTSHDQVVSIDVSQLCIPLH